MNQPQHINVMRSQMHYCIK